MPGADQILDLTPKQPQPRISLYLGASVLELPPGATETITLDSNALAKLMAQGYVNFFALDAN